MKVYVVGDDGPEHNSVNSVHRTSKGALKAWNKLRTKLLDEAKGFLKTTKFDKKMYRKMVKSLSCKDPKRIDNYPHETPYIREWDVKE